MATKAPTALIHHPYRPPEGFDSPQPGIFKASSVFFPNVAAMRSREWKDKTAYTYGLHGTPSSYTQLSAAGSNYVFRGVELRPF